MKKSIYRYFFLLLLGILFTQYGYAQTEYYEYVTEKNLPAYDNRSYKYLLGISLQPGFSFTASSNSAFWILPDNQDPLSNTNAGNPTLNYKKTTLITKTGIKTDTDFITATADQKRVTYEYLDGLGRPIQHVMEKGSPLGYDLIKPIAYDAYGRQPIDYLPYVATSQNGSFQSNFQTAQSAFYNNGNADKVVDDAKPFTITLFEASPLERITEQGAPGQAWQPDQGHGIKEGFQVNRTADNVKMWTSSGPSGMYSEGALMVSKFTDENGNQAIYFKDKKGRKILKRVQLDESIVENGQSVAFSYLETYYVYDDRGNMLYQVPPKAVAKLNGAYGTPATWNQAFINEWVFTYQYDERSRLVEKKVPGSAPQYIGYDPLDRPVLMQDGKLRAQNKWYFTKFDIKGRVVLEGFYTNTVHTTRQAVQQNVLDVLNYDVNPYYEEKQAGVGVVQRYSNQCFPTANTTYIQVRYYDDYDLDPTLNGAGDDYTYTSQGLTNSQGQANEGKQFRATGKLTGAKSLVLGTSTWITKYVFYDQYGNPIQVRSNNQLAGTLDNLATSAYQFDGSLATAKVYKKVATGNEVTIVSKNVYDSRGRVKDVYQQNGADAQQLVAHYDYNELGQLVNKNLHQVGATYLQSLDFRYNIRGWLTHINNSSLVVDANNDDTNDLFGMQLLYQDTQVGLNDAASGGKAYWNGNVSAVKWKVQPDANATVNANPIRERSYKFLYDKVDRLKSATYQAWGGTSWNVETGGYNESTTYDPNGNILSMQRYTLNSGGVTPTLIDQLTYTYSAGFGNQLKKVEDGSGNAAGFDNKGITLAEEYLYDENGNLSKDIHKNSEAGLISYNEINKLEKLDFGGGKYIQYSYDANGNRLKKEVFQNNVSQKVVHYVEGFVFEGVSATLSYFPMPEGRVIKTGSSYTYEYFIRDHLGNTRVSFQAYPSGNTMVARLTQENHYYPFGMGFSGSSMAQKASSASSPANKQLFNAGSELQDEFAELNEYATFFRAYDPVLGRFNAIDPKADAFASWTPYSYAFNNPISFNDPLGDTPKGDAKSNTYDFYEWLSKAWNSPYGGTWNSNGTSSIFTTADDALDAGIAYNNYHNSWGNTAAGSEIGARITYDRINGGAVILPSITISALRNNPKAVEQLAALAHLWFDERGEELFDYWRDGNGQERFLDSEEWGNYMREHKNLREHIEKEAMKYKKGTFKGVTRYDFGGGYRTGYDLLGGSNADVGGLSYHGEVVELGEETRYMLTITWNDIEDPNDGWQDAIAAWMFPGTNYTVHITWTYEFSIYKSLPDSDIIDLDAGEY